MKAYLKEHKENLLLSTYKFHLQEGDIKEASFEWSEKNEEFSYKDEMYDVVTVKYEHDTAIIYCLKDENENELDQQMQLIQQKLHGKGTCLIQKLFPIVFYHPYVTYSYLPSNSASVRHALYSYRIPSTSDEILSPPPRA